MPMGAIVFVDFWFARRLGFHANWAEWAGRSFNRAALLTWVLTLAACLSLNRWAGVEIYFVSLPGWFIAAGPYVVLSRRMQAGFSGGVLAADRPIGGGNESR